jgi:hypothetical protein
VRKSLERFLRGKKIFGFIFNIFLRNFYSLAEILDDADWTSRFIPVNSRREKIGRGKSFSSGKTPPIFSTVGIFVPAFFQPL